ncbi:MAG TPA: MFS transporter [Streptosporangiaceae bacterium]|jgi:MFS family permease
MGAPPPDGVSALLHAPFGWAPLIVVFCVGLVDRIEYNIVSGVLPLIQHQWHIGDAWAGSIPTAAAIAGMIVAVPAGYIADRYRRTRMIGLVGLVVVVWSVITVASGAAVSFAMFYVTRIVLGAAENIDNPVVGSLLGDYYPPRSRDRAFGWTRLTVYAGTAVGTILGGVVGQAAGWRTAFFVMAVPGLIVAWFCLRLREPPRGFVDRVAAAGGTDTVPVPDAAPAARTPGRPAGPGIGAQLKEIMAIRTAVLVGIGVGILTLGLAGIFYWLPSLVYRTYGVGVGAAALTTGGISLVGVLLGTMIGMRLGRRWHGVRRGGRVLAGGGGMLIGSAVLGLSMMMTTFTLFTVLLFASVVIMAIAIPTLTATVADVIGAGSRGVGFGVLQLVLTAGTAGGPLIVGLSSQATGSLTAAMYVLVVPMVIGGAITLAARTASDNDAARVLAAARTDDAPE